MNKINLTDHKQAHKYLLKNCSAISSVRKLLKHNGPILIPKSDYPDLLTSLARTVIGQQLSNKAARAIWSRIIILSSSQKTPLIKLFSSKFTSDLRNCGVSTNKTKALLEIAKHFDINPEFENKISCLNVNEAIEALTSIWGIGQWSAEMVMIFYFNSPDIWSYVDSSLTKGLSRLLKKDALQKGDIDKFILPLSPNRTYFALHIWMGIDKNLI